MAGKIGPPSATSELLSTACVAPVVESYVSMEDIREQGARSAVGLLSEILPWISPRLPVSPALANGSVTVLNSPDAKVKDTGVWIAPLALEKEMVPAQDGAGSGVTLVPAGNDAVAEFTTVIEAVSVLPKPTGGKTRSRAMLIGIVVTCAHSGVIALDTTAAEINRNRRKDMLRLQASVGDAVHAF
jgi:hypothetical protein